MILPTTVELHALAAQRLGLEMEILDPDFGALFALSQGDQRRIFTGGRSILNDAAATRLAEDKYYTFLLLKRAGFRCPATVRCLAPQIPSHQCYPDHLGTAPGLRFAQERGFPLIVKPNRHSLGREVNLVQDPLELEQALERIWAIDTIGLVQERIEGRDLRLDFLDDHYLIGYERIPLQVQGDGQHSLRELIQVANPRFQDQDFFLELTQQTQLLWELQHYGVSLETVIPKGDCLILGAQVCKLGFFCSGRLIPTLSEPMHQHCTQIAQVLGLRQFGIDLRVTQEITPEQTWVIEVNASPLFSAIYSQMDYQEEAIVAQCQVLRAIFPSIPAARG